MRSVSPGFFATLGIPVVQGREFVAGDAILNPRAVIINEAMARREWPGQDAVGQRLTFGPGDNGQPEWLDIVGVVGNVRQYRRRSGAGADYLRAATAPRRRSR